MSSVCYTEKEKGDFLKVESWIKIKNIKEKQIPP